MCFSKKKESDAFAEELLDIMKQNQQNSRISFNYQFSCLAMRDLFFNEAMHFDEFYNNEIEVRKLINMALKLINLKTRLPIPDIYSILPIAFFEKNGIRMIVIEVPNPKYECDCNYIAMVSTSKVAKRYFTNEYYVSRNSFGLGSFYSDGSRVSMRATPQTREEFVDAIANSFPI